MSAGIGQLAGRVDPNSRAAFALVDVAACQRHVLNAIAKLHGEGRRSCDQDVATYLRWPIKCVTPRRGELAVAGHIIKAGDKLGPNNRKVTCWAPAPVPARQLELFRAREP